MNYFHSYHAGNFADVVKHCLLLQLLAQLSQKPKPYYVLDAYGGRGLYSLVSDEAKKTNEAKLGVTCLLAHDNTHAPPAVQTYLQDLAAAKARYDKHVYPGSPWFIAHHAEKYPEPTIRAEAFERHADEYDALNYQLHQLPIGIHHRNAYEGVLAVVPPQEKRGLVLLDPPFEQEHRDFSSLVELLVKAHSKWATGVFALWYPLKNSDAVSLFYKKMQRTTIRRQLVLELYAYPPDVPMGLNGSGLLVINPPWQFDVHAAQILDYLQPILQHPDSPPIAKDARTQVRWLVGE